MDTSLTFRLPAVPRGLLSLIYPKPRIGASYESDLRLRHRDLTLRTTDDLRREHNRLAVRVALEEGTDQWMAERLARLRAELSTRAEDAQ